jgi:endogenous inhibitor of DNA gyrase (YacG/DUF329 family)
MPMTHPMVLFHVPCPKCGVGNPVEWPHDHTVFHPLKPVRVKLTCAGEWPDGTKCGTTFTAERDEHGSTRYVTHPNAE